MVVPGASIGLFSQVKLEIILYYFTKSFIFASLLFCILVTYI